MKVFCIIFAVFWVFAATSSTSAENVSESTQVTLFDNLDDWSLMNILDLLYFGDLTNLATLGPRYHQLILDHYILVKYGLSQAQIYIHLSDRSAETSVYYLPTGELAHAAKLATGYSSTLSTLSFCPIFSKLIIKSDFSITNTLMQQLAENVNKYCATTPQTIEIRPDWRDPTFAFEYATNVKLCSTINLNSDKLNRFFPRMESLAIFNIDHFNLNGHFPYLTHFELKEMEYGRFDLENFGRSNPQIRSLNVDLPWKLEHMKQINDIFPDLETLQISLKRGEVKSPSMVSKLTSFFGGLFTKPTAEIQSIQFESVKNLTMDISVLYKGGVIVQTYEITMGELARDRLDAMKFGQLETLTFRTRSESFVEDQIDLITQNRDLIEVDFSSIPLSYHQMQRLVYALPKLEKVTLHCEELRTVRHIVSLMQATNLKGITAIVYRETKELLLQATAGLREWHLDDWNGAQRRLTFVRQ